MPKPRNRKPVEIPSVPPVSPEAEATPLWDAGHDDAAEVPWSTFRGATARFVAFG